MIRTGRTRSGTVLVLAILFAAVPGAQQTQEPFTPTVGQAGKDVVWVPTPETLVEKMLDMAAVTPQDVVMDLGSGDGRMIIAAARRGARAIGVEYNPEMVALSQRAAAEAGVADKATFVQGDMYTADISQASVMALFLLTTNLDKLAPKFLDLKPGSRLVLNTFGITGWTPDATERVETDCASWCTAMLYIVPAKVGGTWRLPQGELTLTQEFQMVSGTLAASGQQMAIQNGRLRGEHITFTAGGIEYAGRVNGAIIEGIAKGAGAPTSWKATRAAE
ncbi:MAG TPA: class I SAM-dependent methyltransferase [Vicinamibacterales bacterium]|nr:class I SAM-dependent methyltransferase [Vicinamibacterales bacterium]